LHGQYKGFVIPARFGASVLIGWAAGKYERRDPFINSKARSLWNDSGFDRAKRRPHNLSASRKNLHFALAKPGKNV
jgi:hypothetical protein